MEAENADRHEPSTKRAFNKAMVSVLICVLQIPWLFLVGWASWIYYDYGDRSATFNGSVVIAVLSLVPIALALLLGIIAVVKPSPGSSWKEGLVGIAGASLWLIYYVINAVLSWMHGS